MSEEKMSEEKGLLTSEEEKQFGSFFDDLIDFTKFKGVVWNIVEMLDGKLFTAGITYLDDTLADNIPENLKPAAKAFVLAAIELDYEAMVTHGTELLNQLIDIPKITEDNEAIMISGVLQGIVAVVLNFVNKEVEG